MYKICTFQEYLVRINKAKPHAQKFVADVRSRYQFTAISRSIVTSQLRHFQLTKYFKISKEIR